MIDFEIVSNCVSVGDNATKSWKITALFHLVGKHLAQEVRFRGKDH